MKVLQSTSFHLEDEEKLITALFEVEFPKWIYEEIPRLEADYFKNI